MSSELAVETEPLTSAPTPDGRRIIPITPVMPDGTVPAAGNCAGQPCGTDNCNGLKTSCIDPDKGAGCCCLGCGAFW